jgi:hypothetical protein
VTFCRWLDWQGRVGLLKALWLFNELTADGGHRATYFEIVGKRVIFGLVSDGFVQCFGYSGGGISAEPESGHQVDFSVPTEAGT